MSLVEVKSVGRGDQLREDFRSAVAGASFEPVRNRWVT